MYMINAKSSLLITYRRMYSETRTLHLIHPELGVGSQCAVPVGLSIGTEYLQY